MLKAYFDDSGTHNGSTVIAVDGLNPVVILPQGSSSFNAPGVDSSWTVGGFSMKRF